MEDKKETDKFMKMWGGKEAKNSVTKGEEKCVLGGSARDGENITGVRGRHSIVEKRKGDRKQTRNCQDKSVEVQRH